MFAYAANNPVKYTDPDGNSPIVPILTGVVGVVGSLMLPKQGDGFLYFDNTQPQRLGGYYNFYENFTSNNIVCNIDSLRTDFTNSKGKTSTIWLWKGNYNMVFNGGWHVGAEVGAYGSHSGADDSLLESVSFTLTDKTTEKSVDRSVAGQYWTNRFDRGKSNPADLKLTATLNFKNEKEAKAYCDAVNDKHSNQYFNSINRDKNDYSVVANINGKTVTVTFEQEN